jgi:hypothetical protein
VQAEILIISISAIQCHVQAEVLNISVSACTLFSISAIQYHVYTIHSFFALAFTSRQVVFSESCKKIRTADIRPCMPTSQVPASQLQRTHKASTLHTCTAQDCWQLCVSREFLHCASGLRQCCIHLQLPCTSCTDVLSLEETVDYFKRLQGLSRALPRQMQAFKPSNACKDNRFC